MPRRRRLRWPRSATGARDRAGGGPHPPRGGPSPFPRASSPSRSAAATRALRRSKRWDRLRAGLDLILDQRGADMADLPGGASGLLCHGYKGGADRLVTRVDPGVVSLVAELRSHERQAAEGLSQWKTHIEE